MQIDIDTNQLPTALPGVVGGREAIPGPISCAHDFLHESQIKSLKVLSDTFEMSPNLWTDFRMKMESVNALMNSAVKPDSSTQQYLIDRLRDIHVPNSICHKPPSMVLERVNM